MRVKIEEIMEADRAVCAQCQRWREQNKPSDGLRKFEMCSHHLRELGNAVLVLAKLRQEQEETF